MTKSIKEMMNKQVEKIEQLTQYCTDRDAAKTVVAAMFYSLFCASRELLQWVESMYDVLQNNVVDEYKLDYDNLKRKLGDSANYLKERFDLDSDKELKKVKEFHRNNAQLIIDKEKERDFDFFSCDDFNVEELNMSLHRNIYTLQNNAYGTLKNIVMKLGIIIKEREDFDYEYNQPGKELLDFGLVLKERFGKMQEDYRRTLWVKNIVRVKNTIKYNLRGTEKKDYIDYLNNYKYNADRLACMYLESLESGVHVVLYIYNNRESITQAELEHLFEFIETCNLLEARILAFDVMGEPSGAYKDLFVNKACEQFIEKMVLPSCDNTKYEYSALLFAMMDLGLAQKDKKNAEQFVRFVNRKFCVELKLDDVSKRKRKLLHDSFGSMTNEELEEQFDERERKVLSEKYREYYDILDSALRGEADVDERTKWLISVINGEIADF